MFLIPLGPEPGPEIASKYLKIRLSPCFCLRSIAPSHPVSGRANLRTRTIGRSSRRSELNAVYDFVIHDLSFHHDSRLHEKAEACARDLYWLWRQRLLRHLTIPSRIPPRFPEAKARIHLVRGLPSIVPIR